MIETTRLILRHWQNSDAKELFELAKILLSAQEPAGRRINLWQKAKQLLRMF